ncbi:SdpI family protein [Leifsonia shinshuensis]|uniref:SdpI family protein n=1 Tax=Leifsonia shinshuensis TaxID=150026 RepID=UPI0015CA9AE0
MLPELALTLLVSAIPAVTYLLTLLAIKVGPNPLVGFRISSAMRDEHVWSAVHRSLLPLLIKQLLLSLAAVPVVLGLYVFPASFPFLLVSLIAVMLWAVAVAIRHALRAIDANR